jgi:hypothetical protein
MEGEFLSYTYQDNAKIFSDETCTIRVEPRFYVEGHTDLIFWINYVKKPFQDAIVPIEQNKTLRPARARVFDVVRHFNKQNASNNTKQLILGVVDRDMEPDVGSLPENVYFYDLEDLEIMIISSPAFPKALRSVFKNTHWNRFDELRRKLLVATAEIGALRTYIQNWRGGIRRPSMSDPEIHYGRALESVEELQLCRRKLAQLVCDAQNLNPRKGSDRKNSPHAHCSMLEEKLLDFVNYKPEHQYRRGHDAANILAFFINNCSWPRINPRQKFDTHTITRDLVNSFTESHLRDTEVYEQLGRWSETNSVPDFFSV